MKQIVGPRGNGKTKKTMIAALEDDAYYVCSSPAAMYEKAYAYGINGLRILSYHDVLNENYNKTKRLYIDDVDVFIQTIAPTVAGIALTLND